jgi:DGQHR domain-containing protein
MTAGDLLDRDSFRVDRWNAIDQKGYQREVNPSHAHRLSRYLGRGYVSDIENSFTTHDYKKDGNIPLAPSTTNVLPSSIVINFREVIPVEVLDDGAVRLTLQDWPGYIIDGQHRVEASRELADTGDEDILDYEFPVCITQFSLEEEMVHFRNLNTTANRPPKGLNEIIAHTLQTKYGRLPVGLHEIKVNRATGITMRLGTDPESPWYGRIALGGTRKRSNQLTTQSQLTASFDSLFGTGRFADPEFSNDAVYELVSNFWLAVQTVWPKSVANPESSFIMGHLGYRPLHNILNRIFNNVILNPTKSDFVTILENIKANSGIEDPEGWLKGTGTLLKIAHGYTLAKSRSIATDYLWSALDEKTKLSIKTRLPR